MKKDVLQVLFVTEDFSPSFIGGQGVWGGKLVAYLAQQGVRVTVFAEKREKRNAPHVILVPFCFGNQLLLALFEYFYFIVLCHSRYFDILHANQLNALFFILLRPKNIGRMVVSVHNTWEQIAQHSSPVKRLVYWPLIILESFIFHRADGLLFHTESERRYAVKRYKLTRRPTAVVSIGAGASRPISRRTRQRLRIRLAIPGKTAVILYVGRLVRRKHVDTIFRALVLLQNKRVDVMGIIIGQGRDRKRLESIAPANVRFCGFIGDVDPYFQIADVFVLPSVAEGGVALAAHEAASYGLPLLLSAEAADPQILKDGENGYIVHPTAAAALADNIQNALSRRAAFGAVSRQKAGKLTWEKTASGTISFYRKLLGKRAHIRQ